jgi:peptidoglycan/xylan/chitin deacetylase (PgdA/CDA1 family)
LATLAELRGVVDSALARPRVQFVYLHHVFVDEEAGFRALLRELGAHHTFIGHGDAVERIREGRIDRPYVSISLDDGFTDNERAARILEEFDARGCFFVCPGIVGERNPRRLAEFCANRLDFPAATPFLDWAQLERLVARGHEIGGHTMTHPDLGGTAPDEAASEIRQSYETLVERLGGVRHFAWPRGRWHNMTVAARDAVFAAGYGTCASAVRGAHVAPATGPSANLCLRRDHVLAGWPLSHVRYLLMRNAIAASAATNEWPAEYPRVA